MDEFFIMGVISGIAHISVSSDMSSGNDTSADSSFGLSPGIWDSSHSASSLNTVMTGGEASQSVNSRHQVLPLSYDIINLKIMKRYRIMPAAVPPPSMISKEQCPRIKRRCGAGIKKRRGGACLLSDGSVGCPNHFLGRYKIMPINSSVYTK